MSDRCKRANRVGGRTFFVGVVAALSLGVEVASGSSPAFGCQIQAFSLRGAIDASGVHISIVNVANCRVAIEAVRLTFTRRVQGEPYSVQEPNLPPSVLVRPRGSGSRVLTLKLSAALLAKRGDTCSKEAGLTEKVTPLLPVGSRITVTLISTQGVSETSVVHTTSHPPACLF
jgi:hypothetical protein